MVTFCSINSNIKEDFYSLAQEYLPDTNFAKMRALESEYSSLYIAAMHNGQLIGVVYGWPRRIDYAEDASLCLQGIAVAAKYQKKGYGTLLLHSFMEKARESLCDSISVGSAGGYVEKFYIDNGFIPTCYKAYKNGVVAIEKEYASLEEYYSYKRKNADGFVVLYCPA